MSKLFELFELIIIMICFLGLIIITSTYFAVGEIRLGFLSFTILVIFNKVVLGESNHALK